MLELLSLRFILSPFLIDILTTQEHLGRDWDTLFEVFLFLHIKRGEIVAAKSKKTEPKKKKRLGRTPKYETWLEPDNLIKLEGWARDGLTDEQIAHNIGINVSTLYAWKVKYNEFSEVLKRGKEVVDRIVENALLKSAMGYKFDEVVKERIYNPETGESEMVEVKRTTKDVAPNVTALIFWLKNRQSEKWRDTKNVNAAVEVKNPFDGVETADIKKLIGEE